MLSLARVARPGGAVGVAGCRQQQRGWHGCGVRGAGRLCAAVGGRRVGRGAMGVLRALCIRALAGRLRRRRSQTSRLARAT